MESIKYQDSFEILQKFLPRGQSNLISIKAFEDVRYSPCHRIRWPPEAHLEGFAVAFDEVRAQDVVASGHRVQRTLKRRNIHRAAARVLLLGFLSFRVSGFLGFVV